MRNQEWPGHRVQVLILLLACWMWMGDRFYFFFIRGRDGTRFSLRILLTINLNAHIRNFLVETSKSKQRELIGPCN